MKTATYIGALAGLAVFCALLLKADVTTVLQTLLLAGWNFLWLIPYRGLYVLCYAIGWLILLRPGDGGRGAGIGYLFWVTAVREAVDRLLPVASIGGVVVGVRLLRWRGVALAPGTSSVIVEVVLTLIVSYLFTAVGLGLLLGLAQDPGYRTVLPMFALSIPIPVATLFLLRHGSVFSRAQTFLRKHLGLVPRAGSGEKIDAELRASLQRTGRLLLVGGLQFAALLSGALEIWWGMRLFSHPIDVSAALILESLTLALRHVAFMVPGGIGVQEAGLVLVGHALGVGGEPAIALSLMKRARELIWGIPSLLSWQWMEGRRLQRPAAQNLNQENNR